MIEQAFISLYKQRGYQQKEIDQALLYIQQMDQYFMDRQQDIAEIKEAHLEVYISQLVDQKENKMEHFLALARYFYLLDRQDLYIFFTRIFGGAGVLENIQKRTIAQTDLETAEKIFKKVIFPPLGTSPKQMPQYIKTLMAEFKDNLPKDVYCKILAGNNHRLSEKALEEEKILYKKSASLEEYLQQRHKRKVDELQQHCDQKKVWFEQIITQEVVDFVKQNQEILSAVLKDDTLYVTKIPYDIVNYINADNEKEKRYYACHCPFVREAILQEEDIPFSWCYCSAGFAKFPFEVILERALKVTVLASPLKGDLICRFAINISE